MVAASKSIAPESIIRCGYLPFYEGIFTDHRGVYIDIKTEDIFHRTLPDTNKEIYKRFTTSQVIKCEKYVSRLLQHIDEAQLETKVDQLKNETEKLENSGPGDKDDLIRRSKVLFEKMTQIMRASERSIGKKAYKHGFVSPQVLRQAAEEVIQTKKTTT